MEKEKILAKEGIRDFEKDIRLMSKRELRKHFRYKTRRKLSPSILIKNLIWQAYTWISDGRMEPIEGNLRSFWYMNVKSVLSRLRLKVSGKRYPALMCTKFAELVMEHRLFRYADFGFLDNREFHRTIGKRNGHLILFIEKDGKSSIVRKIAQKYDITSIALRGFPSYLTSEFFVRDLAKAGLLGQPVQLFSLVDYDPAGYWIEQEFVEHLQAYGVKIGLRQSIFKPSLLTPDLVKTYKYHLKPTKRTKNWFALTGGIGGEAYGLELDAMTGDFIREAVGQVITPYLSKDNVGMMQANLEQDSWIEWLKKDVSYRLQL